MKCSLRSSRFVYDGDCVSKKPVVETVCADRCIKYEYSKIRKPVFIGDIQKEKITKTGAKKAVRTLMNLTNVFACKIRIIQHSILLFASKKESHKTIIN